VTSDSQDFTQFHAHYGQAASDAKGGVGPAVFGIEGLEGYTTAEHADMLCDVLEVPPGGMVLDLGAGRGWLGARVAERWACRFVSTDVPFTAVQSAKEVYGTGALSGRVFPVNSDAAALPFAPGIFNAVIHADVLC
jgi:ubiquinone/menaquinone biosynthesis C-methylase UbiE